MAKKRLALASVVLMVFAGCIDALDDDPTDDPADTGTSETMDPDSGGNGDSKTDTGDEGNGEGNQTTGGTVPLELSWTVTPKEGDAPLHVSFNASVVHGNVSVEWLFDPGDGGAVQEGPGVPGELNHTYSEEGNFTAVLNVTAGGVQASVNATVLVSPGGHAMGSLSIDDDPDDATTPFTEILSVDLEVDETDLFVRLNMEMVQPTTDVPLVFTYSVWVDGYAFESFILFPFLSANPLTWDSTDGSYMADGTSQWTDTEVEVTLPLSYLEDMHGLAPPFEVYVTANHGAMISYEVDDRAPNQGTVTVP